MQTQVSRLLILTSITVSVLASSGCPGTQSVAPVKGTPEAAMFGKWKTDLLPPEPSMQGIAEGMVYEMSLEYAPNTKDLLASGFIHGTFTSTMKQKTGTKVAVAVLETLVEGLDVPSSFTTKIPQLRISGSKATNAEPNPWGWPAVGTTVELDAANPDILYFTLVTQTKGVVLDHVRFIRQR
jgi:hypothetical protein